MGDFLKGLGSKKKAKFEAKGIESATDTARPFYEKAAAQFDPFIQPGVNANNATADLLGVGGDPTAANGAFQNYLNSTGYNFRLDQGSKAITGNAAAGGLLNSGSTAKALTGYGQNLGSQEFGNYLGQLGNLTQTGYGASANKASALTGEGNFLYNAGVARTGAAAGGKGVLLNAGGNAINSIINYATGGMTGLDSTSGVK